jgi:hypothetical protein
VEDSLEGSKRLLIDGPKLLHLHTLDTNLRYELCEYA